MQQPDTKGTPVHFPLVNIVPIPGVGVLVEIADNGIHTERYLFTGDILKQIVKAAKEAFSVGQDIIRVVEKSRVD